MSERTERTKSKIKKKTGLAGYFTPFGLRQICDILMVVGAIVILVGIFTHAFLAVNAVVIVGLSMYIVASLLSILRCVKVMRNVEVSPKSAEHKSAVINIVIMGIMGIMAIVGIVAALFW